MNSRVVLAFAVVLALVLGASGGFFAGRSSVEDLHPRRAAANACEPGVDAPACGVKTGDGAKTEPDKRPSPDTRPGTDTKPSLKDAIDSIKVDAPPKGTGKITGTVRTADGSPLPGATVTARAINERRGKRNEKPSIEEEVEETIRRRRYADATSCVGKSDADGKYTVEGLRDEAHWIFAELAGHQIQPSDWRVAHNVRPGAVVDFTAKPVGCVTVDVLMPDGSRPERAYVSWTQRGANGGSSSSGQDWTPDDREMQLEFGAWEVRAMVGEAQEHASDSVAVVIEAGKEPPSITLTVKERVGIKGKLILPAGDTGADIWVNAMFYEGAPPDEAKFIKRGGGGYYRGGEGYWGGPNGGGSNGQGSYVFLDLKPGTYLLGAVRNQKLVASVSVMIGGAMVTQDLAIPEMQSSEIVIVRVLGPDGKNAPEVNLSSGYRVGTSLYGGNAGNRKPDGTYWVAHAPLPEGVEGGSFVITAYSAAWGSMEVAYEKKVTTEVTIKFAEPASLVVTVTGLEGNPHAGNLSVSVVKEGEEAQPYGEDAPASRKEWTFGPLTPGKYEVHLVARNDEDGYWGALTVARESIQLLSGKNTVTLAAPRLYKLKVTLKDKKEIALYMTKDGDGTQNGMYVQTDEKGCAEFGPLVSGRYNITNYSDGTVMVVNVPEQLDVQWEATKINAWRVDMKDIKGYAGQQGFANGDLIVSVDGTEFENMGHMWMLLQNAEDKQNIKFGVQRGAGRLEVTADYNKLFNPDQAGCNLTPTAR
ncbi:MAG: hypothetical protein KBG84_09425 [Planctomycetes bacterium]|nr:hypothetical protein [Planctomycetota bacterium]